MILYVLFIYFNFVCSELLPLLNWLRLQKKNFGPIVIFAFFLPFLTVVCSTDLSVNVSVEPLSTKVVVFFDWRCFFMMTIFFLLSFWLALLYFFITVTFIYFSPPLATIFAQIAMVCHCYIGCFLCYFWTGMNNLNTYSTEFEFFFSDMHHGVLIVRQQFAQVTS